MSEGWDSPRTHHFASWLGVRRRRGDVGNVGAAMAEMRSFGEEALAYVDSLFETHTEEAVEERFGWRAGGRHDIPYSVIKAMLSCQKPFQLWNVERVEVKHRYELEAGPSFHVGAGAALREEEQVPRSIEKATAALRAWLEMAELQALSDESQRRSFARLLRDPLPFGLPDPIEEEAPAAPVARPRPGPSAASGPAAGPTRDAGGDLPPGLPPHILERLLKKRAEQRARKEQQERERESDGKE